MNTGVNGQSFDADVVVVGAGPCGLALASLLGTYGVRATLIEREVEPLDYPRAVGIDDEALRTLQMFGGVDDVLRDTIQNTPIRYYTSWGRLFAHVKPSAQPFGWPRRNLFLQPMMERTLRTGLAKFPTLDVRLGWELAAFVQDDHGVTVNIVGPSCANRTIRARYLVGADGGRSVVRKDLDIELLGSTQTVKWLVVDVANDDLDAPYSAVYCHSKQPTMMIPLPYRHRRWEFRLPLDVDEQAVTQPDHIASLLRPRYPDGMLPQVVRARVYLHHSRTAATFQRGRVFLAGDAAHLQPPFFGQGMNSGIRDATNLAWKLAAVVKGQASDALLATYDAERRPIAAEMVQFATRIGSMYAPRNVVTERFRDLLFRGVQRFPGGRDYVLQMKYKPMPLYTDGVVVHSNAEAAKKGKGAVGRMFAQPDVERGDGTRCKLDDAIGTWWVVIGIFADPRENLRAQTIAWWESIGATFVRVDRAKQRHRGESLPDDGLLHIEDVDGSFRDLHLTNANNDVIVLRPDRCVAAITGRAGLEQVSAKLRHAMGK
jgi:3-(3-hydroxy-phenyl)propionate hydroxylase